jgi:hypothetical protein
MRDALIAICVVTATPSFALESTFDHPTYGSQEQLDVCYIWGKQCGQKPANMYCKVHGYQRATHFDTEPARPTRLGSNGKLCDGDFCVGFKSITCFTSASQPGIVTPWPHSFGD